MNKKIWSPTAFRSALSETGVTVKALAENIGVPDTTVRYWLRDRDPPTGPSGVYLVMASEVLERHPSTFYVDAVRPLAGGEGQVAGATSLQ